MKYDLRFSSYVKPGDFVVLDRSSVWPLYEQLPGDLAVPLVVCQAADEQRVRAYLADNPSLLTKKMGRKDVPPPRIPYWDLRP